MDLADVQRVGDGVVIRPRFDPEPRAFDSLTEEHWDAAWEQPMRATIEALQQAHHDGVRHIVVVVPTTGMSGSANYAHVAAPAEAIRVLVKSAARQWGADGITVNAVAVDPASVLRVPEAAGPISLAPAALPEAEPTKTIEFLCSAAAADITGQTITVDGGRWL